MPKRKRQSGVQKPKKLPEASQHKRRKRNEAKQTSSSSSSSSSVLSSTANLAQELKWEEVEQETKQ